MTQTSEILSLIYSVDIFPQTVRKGAGGRSHYGYIRRREFSRRLCGSLEDVGFIYVAGAQHTVSRCQYFYAASVRSAIEHVNTLIRKMCEMTLRCR